jgi:hypothetical protein
MFDAAGGKSTREEVENGYQGAGIKRYSVLQKVV